MRIVLVHGALDRGASFGRVTRRLGPSATVLAPDRPGYGSRLDEPPPVGMDRHAAALWSAMGEEPAVVVGHSFGGLVALRLAIEHPSLVPAVAVYEPPQPWRPWWPPPEEAEPSTPADAAETFFVRMVGAEAWRRLPERERARRRREGAALQADQRDARAWTSDLRDLVVPAVVGSGSRSTPLFRRGAEQLATELGARHIEIAGASHGAHLTHPDAFAALVRAAVELATAAA